MGLYADLRLYVQHDPFCRFKFEDVNFEVTISLTYER